MRCTFPLVVVSIMPHEEFGPNDHHENALHFIMSKLTRGKPGQVFETNDDGLGYFENWNKGGEQTKQCQVYDFGDQKFYSPEEVQQESSIILFFQLFPRPFLTIKSTWMSMEIRQKWLNVRTNPIFDMIILMWPLLPPSDGILFVIRLINKHLIHNLLWLENFLVHLFSAVSPMQLAASKLILWH